MSQHAKSRGLFYLKQPLLWIFLLLISGMALMGAPSDPDLVFSGPRRIGLFLLFLSWIGSVLEWGALLSLGAPSFFNSCVMGSIWAAGVAFLFGVLGWIGHDYQGLLIFVGLAGSLFHSYFRNQTRSVSQSKGRKWSPVGWGVVALIFIAGLLQASIPQNQGDPLYYHLWAPKFWVDTGRITIDRSNPLLAQASYWEFIYIWANAWVGGPGRFGLIEVQIFCQWIHFVLGFGGSALSLYYLFNSEKLTSTWLALFIAAGLTTGSTLWTYNLAKSDWGLIFWMLAGLVILLRSEKSSFKQPLLAGILFGISLGCKITNAYFILAVLFVYFGTQIRSRSFAACLTGIAVGVLPVWIKNFVFVGNPVYPMLNSIFKSPFVGPSFQEINRKFLLAGRDLTGAHFWRVFKTLIVENPTALFLVLLPFASIAVGKSTRSSPRGSTGIKKSQILFLLQVLAIVGVVFGLTVGEVFFWRYAGPFTVLLCCLGVYSLAQIQRVPVRVRQALCGAVIVFQAWQGIEVWNSHYAFWSSPSELIRLHLGGASKAWLRLNAKPEDIIVSGYDPQIYYLAGNRVQLFEYDPDLDRASLKVRSPEGLCKFFRETGAKYLLESWLLGSSSLPWGWKMSLFRELEDHHPEWILFRSKDSWVVDILSLCNFVKNHPAEGAVKYYIPPGTLTP